MRIRDDAWLTGLRRVPSPNCDERPDPADVSLLVIHAISLPPEQFSGPAVEQLFRNQLDPAAHPFFESIKDLKVSAHLFIRRSGAMLQFVPFTLRAWHAGVSEIDGRRACNDFSVGIELEGSDHRRFTTPQYRCLARVTGLLMSHYPKISADRIVGHSDIAPGRKTDPGPFFDWQRYRSSLS